LEEEQFKRQNDEFKLKKEEHIKVQTDLEKVKS
jgi:hypothetical protein